MNTGLVGVWAVGWGQQKWCLNTVLKDELEFVTLGWAGGQRRSGWVEGGWRSPTKKGAEAGTMSWQQHGAVVCGLGHVRWGSEIMTSWT